MATTRGPLVRDVMNCDVIAISPEASLSTAAQRMRDRRIGCMPVVDEGQLVGMVTDRDLVVRGLAETQNLARLHVRDVMSVGLVACSAEQSLDDARYLMADKGVVRLPVIDRAGRLIGLVSRHDIEGRAPYPRSRRVVFSKVMTNSVGSRCAVEVGRIHLSPAIENDDVGNSAIRRFEHDHDAHPWHLKADEYQIKPM